MVDKSSEPVLRLNDIFKVYMMGGQEVYALDGVSLEVYPGEFVAIMGPSGSGKSTMMNLIGCLDVPTSGSYEIDGVEVSTLDEIELAAIRNKKIGFVFQGFNLIARTTALENVELPLMYGRQSNRTERAVEALRKVGLGDRLGHTPSELSGGQQQRVAIARAIVSNPRLILADEPTGNISTIQSEEIMQIFQELNDSGTTIVMVTHEEDIGRHCSRRVEMRDGKITSDEIVKDRIIAKDLLIELKIGASSSMASKT